MVVMMVLDIVMVLVVLNVGMWVVGGVVRVGLIIRDEAVMRNMPPPCPFDTPHQIPQPSDAGVKYFVP